MIIAINIIMLISISISIIRLSIRKRINVSMISIGISICIRTSIMVFFIIRSRPEVRVPKLPAVRRSLPELCKTARSPKLATSETGFQGLGVQGV